MVQYQCCKTKSEQFTAKVVCTHYVKQRPLSRTRPLLQKGNALNIFQINICQHLTFMCKFNNDQVQNIFYDIIKNQNTSTKQNYEAIVSA